MTNDKFKFYVEKTGFWAQSAAVLLVIAAIFQVLACWGLWQDRMVLLTQIALPTVSYICFALLLIFCGKSTLWLTAIPFLGGAAFYVWQVWFSEDRLFMLLTLSYCVVAVVLYLGTVFCIIRTKWLLPPLFLLPFLYRAFYRDVLILQNAGETASFSAGMREISMLFVLLALTLATLGFRKYVKAKKHKTSAYELAGKTPAPAAGAAPVPDPAPAPESEPPQNQEFDQPHEPSLSLETGKPETENE